MCIFKPTQGKNHPGVNICSQQQQCKWAVCSLTFSVSVVSNSYTPHPSPSKQDKFRLCSAHECLEPQSPGPLCGYEPADVESAPSTQRWASRSLPFSSSLSKGWSVSIFIYFKIRERSAHRKHGGGIYLFIYLFREEREFLPFFLSFLSILFY